MMLAACVRAQVQDHSNLGEQVRGRFMTARCCKPCRIIYLLNECPFIEPSARHVYQSLQ